MDRTRQKWMEFICWVAAMGLIGFTLASDSFHTDRECYHPSTCRRNLQQIALALLNYESVWQRFPPAYTVAADGKRLHSWRVLILPFLEEGELYKQIDLNKPWNDPANSVVLKSIPFCYRCPSADLDSNGTSYLVIVGPGTAFPGWQGRSTRSALGGLANTLLVVESASQDIYWAEPRDVEVDDLREKLTQRHKGAANAALCSGAIIQLGCKIDPQELRSMALIPDVAP